MDCIFCKIANKEIPSTIVYEDDSFLGFLDIHPVVKGHILLIPKAHYPWMHEAPDELVAKTYVMAKKLMNTMRKGLGCDYVHLAVVGKDVPHFHIHLFPRWLDDKLTQFPTVTYESEEEQNNIAQKIKNAL